MKCKMKLTKNTLNILPLKEKWRSFNWKVIDIDGHSFVEIDKAIKNFIQKKINQL